MPLYLASWIKVSMKDGTANAGAGDEKDVVSTPRRK